MDYKSSYPERLTYEGQYDAVIEDFGKKFDEEIVPLYKGSPIYKNLVNVAFHNYLNDAWDEFVERVKEETK